MPPSATIHLTDLPARLRLGVSPGERAAPQDVCICFEIDLAHPPFADRIEDTLNYDDVIGFVRDGLDARGPFQLIETVAETCALHVVSLSGLVTKVRVTVKKPSVLAAPALVSVTFTTTAGERPAQVRP